jgi:hypothetical protein
VEDVFPSALLQQRLAVQQTVSLLDKRSRQGLGTSHFSISMEIGAGDDHLSVSAEGLFPNDDPKLYRTTRQMGCLIL